MEKGKRKRILAEAHLEQKIDESYPSRLGAIDATYLVMKDCRELLTELVNLEREKAGKDELPAREELPTRVKDRRGILNWAWPKRK